MEVFDEDIFVIRGVKLAFLLAAGDLFNRESDFFECLLIFFEFGFSRDEFECIVDELDAIFCGGGEFELEFCEGFVFADFFVKEFEGFDEVGMSKLKPSKRGLQDGCDFGILLDKDGDVVDAV